MMRDPTKVEDSRWEWFELYNSGPTAVNLRNWVVTDDDFVFVTT
jgi:hypothetical protein